MAISYIDYKDSQINKIFKLDTPKSSYCIGIVDDEGIIGHLYYGAYINDINISALTPFTEAPFVPSKNNRDRGSIVDSIPLEYPTQGLGDYREICLGGESVNGYNAVGLVYSSFEIMEGKNEIPGLPATFADKSEADTLILHCEDKVLNLKVDLIYTAFRNLDVITRSVRIINASEEKIYLTKVLSGCLDMKDREFEAVTLHGSWARERRIESQKLTHNNMVFGSKRGESSHQDNPFLMIKSSLASDEYGEVYGLNFVYSGNFIASAGKDQFDNVRVTMGIHPENFKWKLEKGEEFNAPEVVMVYSGEGIGHMTRTFHDLYRQNLIRSPYKNMPRPVLINNWEATYFDFDTEKLIAIAKEASACGIEMLVMDDGWFGNRFDDNRALGDWKVNEEKLKGGLKYLVDEVNKLGLKFGIWFEPEMISPDSDLYREHPDWAIAIPGRIPVRSRNQYVLDMSRPEVVEYTYKQVSDILRSANIEYVKWDMNRQLTDLGSYYLDSERMGELSHRYVLGVYSLQERLLQDFPNLLLENCSGGGGRFDPGMLYYSPQIWCSDDTDALERLSIQEGTSLVYPLSSMGAHVSDCPNHIVGRNTPFETRGNVALFGTFGYELDVTRISKEDRALIPFQVETYHKYNELIRSGDYYRIASLRENSHFDCFGVVSKDKKEALYIFVRGMAKANQRTDFIRLKGLQSDKKYIVEGFEERYTGDILSKVGIPVALRNGDFASKLIHVIEA